MGEGWFGKVADHLVYALEVAAPGLAAAVFAFGVPAAFGEVAEAAHDCGGVRCVG